MTANLANAWQHCPASTHSSVVIIGLRISIFRFFNEPVFAALPLVVEAGTWVVSDAETAAGVDNGGASAAEVAPFIVGGQRVCRARATGVEGKSLEEGKGAKTPRA